MKITMAVNVMVIRALMSVLIGLNMMGFVAPPEATEKGEIPIYYVQIAHEQEGWKPVWVGEVDIGVNTATAIDHRNDGDWWMNEEENKLVCYTPDDMLVLRPYFMYIYD